MALKPLHHGDFQTGDLDLVCLGGFTGMYLEENLYGDLRNLAFGPPVSIQFAHEFLAQGRSGWSVSPACAAIAFARRKDSCGPVDHGLNVAPYLFNRRKLAIDQA